MAGSKWTKEEVAEYRKANGSVFYFNRDDSNIFVPKTYGFGLTVNWGNPIALIIIVVIIAFVVLRSFFRYIF